jgi:hypothetical protein
MSYYCEEPWQFGPNKMPFSGTRVSFYSLTNVFQSFTNFFLTVLGIKPSVPSTLGKCSVAEVHPMPWRFCTMSLWGRHYCDLDIAGKNTRVQRCNMVYSRARSYELGEMVTKFLFSSRSFEPSPCLYTHGCEQLENTSWWRKSEEDKDQALPLKILFRAASGPGKRGQTLSFFAFLLLVQFLVPISHTSGL